MDGQGKHRILIGTKFYGHDSSIFIIDQDQKDIFAIQTERLTRFKHDTIFPIESIKRYIQYKNIDADKVDEVVVGNSFIEIKDLVLPKNIYKMEVWFRKHFRTRYKKDFDAKFKKHLTYGPVGKIFNLLSSPYGILILIDKAKQFLVPSYGKWRLEDIIIYEVKRLFPNATIKNLFFDHEYCHALSSYFTSGFDEALLFTFDGWGDNSFSKVYSASDRGIVELFDSKFDFLHYKGKRIPVSVGGIYTMFTEELGFTPDADEGKVEALAAYGDRDTAFFTKYMAGLARVDTEKHAMVIDIESLKKLSDFFSSDEKGQIKKEDLAAAVQSFLEKITEEYLKHVVAITGIKKICLSGGVAANVINNLNIFEKITKDIHIVPAMADDGSAQGAAIANLLANGYSISELAWLKKKTDPFYSTSYNEKDTLAVLEKHKDKITYKYLGKKWQKTIATLITRGQIGAIFQNKMEWGPRALGNRSIVADPRRKDIRDILNKQIKRRPLFQPFCPSILIEEKDRLFENSYNNQHMTCAFRMRKEFWENLPCAIHIDGTARAQFVDQTSNPDYYELLKKVKETTGFGILINTSFNKHGRTIVESPDNAVTDFLDTDMDYLFINGYLINRIFPTAPSPQG